MSFDKVGYKYKNFKVTKNLYIEEIKANLIELEHQKLGTKIVKILNDDEDNLFCISFETYPDSSNGAAHILEHTVLCGSKKFPVKDPFFSMMRRSLATFMNAMTGSDFTCYPASSMVEKDFYNLFDVYVDAVFHPNLNKLSFMQEGHRYEFTSAQDASSPLKIKGIVFNEMKGSMSNPDNILTHKMMSYLTPDLTYAFNSGGDPEVIPTLSYEDLLEFHKKFYHPSRSIFFLYGNLDLKKQLDFIEKNAIADFNNKPPLEKIKKQKLFDKPKIFKDNYPLSQQESLNKNSIVSFGFLTCDIENQLDYYGLELLDYILMGTDGSYLKKELLSSKLLSFTSSSIDAEMIQIPYFITCKGCEDNSLEAIYSIITKVLNNFLTYEIPKNVIEAALHQLEFSRLEITNEDGPYGLNLFFKAVLLKNYNIEVESALVIHTLFNKLREKLKEKNYLKSLVKKYFLENNHIVKLILNPDHHYMEKKDLYESEVLKQVEEHLNPEDIEKIIKDTSDLEKYQKKLESQSIECLPKLKIKDIPKKARNFPLKTISKNSFEIYHHDVFTNDILYVDLLFDLPYLSLEEMDNLSLFISLLTQIGLADRDYSQNLEYIDLYTGGFNSYLLLNVQADNINDFNPFIGFTIKSLTKNKDKLFELLKDVLLHPNFDDIKRIKELVEQKITILQSSILKNSMRYAVSLSQSAISTSLYLSNRLFGFDYFLRLKKLTKNIDKNILEFIDTLKSIHSKVFLKSPPSIIISSEEKDFETLEKNNFYDLVELDITNSKPFEKNINVPKINSSYVEIPANVAFIASSYKTFGFSNPHTPHLLVASQLLENLSLHKNIREIGGAYGSKANFSTTYGVFTFQSYRDPNINSTLNSFKNSVRDLVKDGFSKEDLFQAKLGIIQQTDMPISPGMRAITQYNWIKSKKSLQMRQTFRDNILKTTKKDIIGALKILLDKLDEETTVIYAGKELIEKEKPKLAKLKIE